MDQNKFTDHKTGNLVDLDERGRECAFVPNTLPSNWEFPERLWPALADAREKLGTLNGIGRTLPDPQLLLRPLQDRESLRSSSLEGTYATPVDLLLFDKQQREPKSEDDPVNSWKEVWNYGAALRGGMEELRDNKLSKELIRRMHYRLLNGVRGKDKKPGDFRLDQVHIGSDRRYVPPPAIYVENLMFDLEAYMSSNSDNLDPLVRCFVVHYQFEAIHPFLDGNGRVGRALLSLMVMHVHEHNLPWLYLSEYFERYKDEYVDNMFQISANGEWDTWIEFCLRGVIEYANDAVTRIDSLKSLQEQYKASIDINRPRVHRILDDLFSSPVLTKPELASRLDVAYKTASADVKHLVKRGILEEVPHTNRPTSYYAPEIVKIAFN